MEPIDVNGSVHTARKQHQRKNITICVRVASRVLCGLGLMSLFCNCLCFQNNMHDSNLKKILELSRNYCSQLKKSTADQQVLVSVFFSFAPLGSWCESLRTLGHNRHQTHFETTITMVTYFLLYSACRFPRRWWALWFPCVPIATSTSWMLWRSPRSSPTTPTPTSPSQNPWGEWQWSTCMGCSSKDFFLSLKYVRMCLTQSTGEWNLPKPHLYQHHLPRTHE